MTTGKRIAGFAAVCEPIAVGGDTVALWRVADLAAHVDRAALLAGDDPAEPPYWAHLWSGARLLAAAVPRAAGRTVEIGCGLGLPGLTAARRGARVVFVDRVPAALAFVRASAAANGSAVDVVAADVTTGAVRGPFDLVLAAEVLYDRPAFPALARALAALVGTRGRALLADAGRVDTRDFYGALDLVGLRWTATEHRMREEGLSLTVRLVAIEPR